MIERGGRGWFEVKKTVTLLMKRNTLSRTRCLRDYAGFHDLSQNVQPSVDVQQNAERMTRLTLNSPLER